jgi:hypothetical protein
MPSFTDNKYAEFAKGDKDWIQLAASAKIEGIAVDPRDEVLAGRFLKGEITQDQWSEAIHTQLGYPAKANTKTEAWLRRIAPLIHRMSNDEEYRRTVATQLS